TTWQTTSFFVFSLVRNRSCPGATPELKRITAPEPNTSTVCVVSENGSRLSLPSTVRTPFTLTEISRATGCTFGCGALATGAAEFCCPGSFTLDAMNTLAGDNFSRSPHARDSALPLYIHSYSNRRAIVHAYYRLPCPSVQARFFQVKCFASRKRLCQRRLELLINLHLVARHHFVRLIRHSNDGLQFLEHFRGHSLFERGRCVRRN